MENLLNKVIQRFIILDFHEGFGDLLMEDEDDDENDDNFNGNEDYEDEEADLMEDLEDMNLY